MDVHDSLVLFHCFSVYVHRYANNADLHRRGLCDTVHRCSYVADSAGFADLHRLVGDDFGVLENGALTSLTLPAALTSVGGSFVIEKNTLLAFLVMPLSLAVWQSKNECSPDAVNEPNCVNSTAEFGRAGQLRASQSQRLRARASNGRRAILATLPASSLCDNANCDLAPNSCHGDGVCDRNSEVCIAPAPKVDGTPATATASAWLVSALSRTPAPPATSIRRHRCRCWFLLGRPLERRGHLC